LPVGSTIYFLKNEENKSSILQAIFEIVYNHFALQNHRAPTEITLIFCTEFYYHANIGTNGNTRSLEKFLYEILYHPEFVQFDLDRKIMRHLLDPTIRTFDQSACRRGEFLCAGTRVRLYPNIKKILYFISSRAFRAYTILRVKSESLH
jgi:hypothetical protein